jgi:prevent-host-death family protein
MSSAVDVMSGRLLGPAHPPGFRFGSPETPVVCCAAGRHISASKDCKSGIDAIAKDWRKNAATMNRGYPMTTLTASEATANLNGLIDQAAESHRPVFIAGKGRSAVLVSEEDWNAIQETLFLLSIPGMRESIKGGMKESLSESSKELDW